MQELGRFLLLDAAAAAGPLLPVCASFRGRPRGLVPLDDDVPDDDDDLPCGGDGLALKRLAAAAAAPNDDEDEDDDAGGNGAPLLALVG